ncbi:MAG: nucleotidyl transferase AbiEii/AbiGii toxin family protein [Paludibacteraceae bacterium]|nr:nucleotidyl transferase AbiEii/AbiGii toxin family protein [Paludibacteraceae bacterium]
MSAINYYKLPLEDKLTIINDLADTLKRPAYAIEKDWWVVQTLRLLMQMEVSKHMIFKGGTSLSKAWHLIDRFSEDIDLAIDREFLGFSGKISRTQVGKLRDASYTYLSETFFPALKSEFASAGITDVQINIINVQTPDQDPLQIEIVYTPVVKYTTYVSPRVILEIGSRSMMEPNTLCSFSSMIGENYPDLPFADTAIHVPTANPERTYLDKLFLLHEEFQRTDTRVDRLSRHLYDIEKIARTPYAKAAIADKELYHAIVAHRELFNRFAGVDYKTHFPPTLNPVPPANLLSDWEKDYIRMQQEMIYGESLSFSELLKRIKDITVQINQQKI